MSELERFADQLIGDNPNKAKWLLNVSFNKDGILIDETTGKPYAYRDDSDAGLMEDLNVENQSEIESE